MTDTHTCKTEQPESAGKNEPSALGNDLRAIAELADTGLLDGTGLQFWIHVQNPARVQAIADRVGGTVRRYRASTGMLQAHNMDAMVGSVEVSALIHTDTPWSGPGKSDETWAEILRNGK